MNILHSLKIEWLKLKNYNAFWILLGLFVLSIFGINYIMIETMPRGQITEALAIFSFPKVWHTASYMSSFMLLFPGLIMIMTVTGEFGFRTHRQNVIDGMSRTNFITVKMLVALILAVISTLAVFVFALIFGILEGSTVSFDGVKYIFLFFLQAIDYIGIALLFSMFLRKTGLCVGIYILYALILENVISSILARNVGQIAYYLPLESSDKLIPMPIFKEFTNQIVKTPDVGNLLIACILYIIMYVIVCKLRFEKADL
ncbi:MAG: ABC transporter permease [Prevotellaceae bacterium]|jgi:ABC-type transport system involved in multi-copper enzyme maturation permease subunit|nr:ABC transporter permease [Prevotellaceae bacterium]